MKHQTDSTRSAFILEAPGAVLYTVFNPGDSSTFESGLTAGQALAEYFAEGNTYDYELRCEEGLWRIYFAPAGSARYSQTRYFSAEKSKHDAESALCRRVMAMQDTAGARVILTDSDFATVQAA